MKMLIVKDSAKIDKLHHLVYAQILDFGIHDSPFSNLCDVLGDVEGFYVTESIWIDDNPIFFVVGTRRELHQLFPLVKHRANGVVIATGSTIDGGQVVAVGERTLARIAHALGDGHIGKLIAVEEGEVAHSLNALFQRQENHLLASLESLAPDGLDVAGDGD